MNILKDYGYASRPYIPVINQIDTLTTSKSFQYVIYIRGFCLLLATYSMPSMVIERVFATILLKDYEYTSRPYIPVIIATMELSLSTFSMYLYYQGNL
uniref:Uncharacterized protein n=1 Tax=Panagrolaimus davidi TaxID=227884 RepID=A0A914Q6R0_9BILA